MWMSIKHRERRVCEMASRTPSRVRGQRGRCILDENIVPVFQYYFYSRSSGSKNGDASGDAVSHRKEIKGPMGSRQRKGLSAATVEDGARGQADVKIATGSSCQNLSTYLLSTISIHEQHQESINQLACLVQVVYARVSVSDMPEGKDLRLTVTLSGRAQSIRE